MKNDERTFTSTLTPGPGLDTPRNIGDSEEEKKREKKRVGISDSIVPGKRAIKQYKRTLGNLR
jgi:hypothetical protein